MAHSRELAAICSRCLLGSIGLLVIAGLVAAAPAQALTTVSYSGSNGLVVSGDGTGEGAAVLLRASPRRFEVIKSGFGAIPNATLAPGTGCSNNANGVEVDCPATGNLIVTASLRAGNDNFDVFSEIPSGGDSFIHGGDGDDRIIGGQGFDAIAGDGGDDTIGGGGGNDTVDGGDGDDRFDADGGGTDTIHGGAGNDTLVAEFTHPSPDLFDGGSGRDAADYRGRSRPLSLTTTIATTTSPNDGEAGEGDDLDSVETLIGGSGDDTLEVSSLGKGAEFLNPPTEEIFGLAGADTLRVVGPVPSSLDGGNDSDTVSGGSRVDDVMARDGVADRVTCGAGIDFLSPDLHDEPISDTCENLEERPLHEGPNVVIRSRSLLVHADGRLSARLACPRELHRRCRGKLAARLDRRGRRFGRARRYSIRPGHSKRVKVKLRRGQVRRARRRGSRVRLRSIERGVLGRKTTTRSLPTRAG